MRVLCIGAHIDECEYGVGGVSTILIEKGHTVRWLNPATYLHVKDERRAEMRAQSDAAAQVIGAEKITWPNEQHDKTWVCDKENIMKIQQEIESFKPDIMFIQWPKDNHPEHAHVALASYYAISNALSVKIHEIYAYEAGLNQTSDYFVPDFTIEISGVFDRVGDSLRCYATTNANGDELVMEKRIQAQFRARQNGQKLSEGFRIVKYPDGGDDFYLREIAGDCFRWCGCRQYPGLGREYFI